MASCYIESGINLFKSLLKELGWTMHAMFLSAKKQNTLLTLKLDPAHHQRTQKNAGSRERRAELRRSARRLQLIYLFIKVSPWQLYNIHDQQEVLKPKIVTDIDCFVFKNLVVDKVQPVWQVTDRGQTVDITNTQTRQHDFSFPSSSE